MNTTISLLNGTKLPRLGQGTWYLGDSQELESQEIDTLRRGVELGLNLIDTAEMYGGGRSETLVGKAIEDLKRDELFLVSKVLPSNAGEENLEKSLDQSLERMKTNYLDLYLLHWQGSIPLKETVRIMEAMVAKGKIRGWGVSNFDTKAMRSLYKIPEAEGCLVNQVLYHLGSRGIEYNLLPSLAHKEVPVMAYCPLAQGGALRKGLVTHPSVLALAEKYHVAPTTILLAFTLQEKWVCAIPKSGSVAHVEENAKARGIIFTQEDMDLLEKSFPRPKSKEPLDIV